VSARRRRRRTTRTRVLRQDPRIQLNDARYTEMDRL
jgi:hypothetical protein